MLTIVFGLVALALGLWGLSAWWWSVVEILRGLMPIVLTLLGLVAIGAGVTRIRESIPSPSEPDEDLMEDDPKTGE
ncbi:MAG: hypothetical protein HQL54_05400 [Magnetococcales bacterium]|nr:hypothetical protein [Magnetococcales bacterium]